MLVRFIHRKGCLLKYPLNSEGPPVSGWLASGAEPDWRKTPGLIYWGRCGGEVLLQGGQRGGGEGQYRYGGCQTEGQFGGGTVSVPQTPDT